MSKYYYKKERARNFRKFFRTISVFIFFIGLLAVLYIFSPLISWQIYFAKSIDAQSIKAPIPKSTIVNPSLLKSLIVAGSPLNRVDYTNAQNWFPAFNPQKGEQKISSYTLSIPKLGIKNAIVSTTDYDLTRHLVNYGGLALPPENGNTVIFGHSTLPQLFNPRDYKTIFSTLYKLSVGDTFLVEVSQVSYSYKIHSITVVPPEETSIFAQDSDTSHITLVTCTPPGTTWKRLIIKARLESI